ncbi:general substrate transporter [Aspergillus pseudoustus]|uniref:General substrate transporter n=1 Tax=Aspergillus pseudoustus TaxID=1810923 RepID=A0ABR4IRM5_9EURO
MALDSNRVSALLFSDWSPYFVLARTVAGRTSNRFGRKAGIFFGIFLLSVSTALQTAAPSDTAFIIARLIVGASSGFLNNAAPPVANALFMCGYYLGALIAAWITFGTHVLDSSWAWRIPSITQMVCAILALPDLLILPEIPRWLVSMNRVPEARAALAYLHASGDTFFAVVIHQLISIQHTLELEQDNATTSGYAEMTSTPGNRHRLFITVSVGFYAHQHYGNKGQLLISGCLQIWNLIFATIGASLVEKAGCQILFLLSGAIMLVSYITIAGLSGGTAVVPFLFIYFAGYDIALTPLLTAYPCEVWPFRLRSRDLSIAWVSVVFVNMFNTFVNPIALDSIGWRYYFVFVAVLIAYEITVFFEYPETRGHSLEDMALVFDKDEGSGRNEVEERGLDTGKTGAAELVDRV